MKIHLPWIRVTAAAVLVAGVGVHEAAAQYAPYRPIPQQPAAPAQAAPQQAQVPVVAAPPTQQPYYTAYRTQPAAPTQAYGVPQSTAAYGSPTGAQYTQPTAAYPQYPQTAGQYPQTQAQQYPTNYGSYSYVAQQPATETMPAPKNMSAAQPSANGAMMAAPAGGMPANNGVAGGACGCNAANYGAGDYYTAPGSGCGATGGYPNCGVGNYMADNSCNQNQWFGGIYFLGMTRTDATPVKLTSQIATGTAYPYWPEAQTNVLTNRDANYDFREGLELRVGSTFTIGEPCNACQSSCGYNTTCGCNSCTPPTVYAWEVAWWGINNSPDEATIVYDTERLVGMKNYAGLQYNSNPVNGYYGYELPVLAGPADPQILAQRVRTDFKVQNLELNFIRFPVCNTGCSSGGCGCDDSCGLGFSMYGSCGVRYFRVDDDFNYGTEFNPGGAHPTYDGFGTGDAYELFHDIQIDNNLIGPQVGWTTDYCLGKWNLFCNSTFGIFNNHMSVRQRMFDGTGTNATFYGDGSDYNLKSSKDAVAFLGELRVGTAYDISCHWRAVVAYRAVAITGVATASEQLQGEYSDRYSAGIIDSDNSLIVHGAQIGAECRY